MPWYSWVWLVWGSFGVAFELFVLALQIEGAPLSNHLWTMRDTESGFFSLIIFFLLWLVFHLLFEGKGGVS